jgi:hypothetical protein
MPGAPQQATVRRRVRSAKCVSRSDIHPLPRGAPCTAVEIHQGRNLGECRILRKFCDVLLLVAQAASRAAAAASRGAQVASRGAQVASRGAAVASGGAAAASRVAARAASRVAAAASRAAAAASRAAAAASRAAAAASRAAAQAALWVAQAASRGAARAALWVARVATPQTAATQDTHPRARGVPCNVRAYSLGRSSGACRIVCTCCGGREGRVCSRAPTCSR